jgi:hypothetical protein
MADAIDKRRSRFNIEVTEDDITTAHVNDSYRCVVAQAIARQIPGSRRIEVDLQTIRWSDENGRHVFLTPYSVAGYVVAFDAGEELHPFRFQLRDPHVAAQKKANSKAAKAAVKSRGRITTERQRLFNAESTLADPDASAEEIAVAHERVKAAPARIEAAQAAHEDLKAAYKAAGESISEERVTETKRVAAPKVFKTKRREYGHRVLRVNQAEGRKHYAG